MRKNVSGKDRCQFEVLLDDPPGSELRRIRLRLHPSPRLPRVRPLHSDDDAVSSLAERGQRRLRLHRDSVRTHRSVAIAQAERLFLTVDSNRENSVDDVPGRLRLRLFAWRAGAKRDVQRSRSQWHREWSICFDDVEYERRWRSTDLVEQCDRGRLVESPARQMHTQDGEKRRVPRPYGVLRLGQSRLHSRIKGRASQRGQLGLRKSTVIRLIGQAMKRPRAGDAGERMLHDRRRSGWLRGLRVRSRSVRQGPDMLFVAVGQRVRSPRADPLPDSSC